MQMRTSMMGAAFCAVASLFVACGDNASDEPYNVVYSAIISGNVTLDTLVFINEQGVYSPPVELTDTVFNGSVVIPQGFDATIRAKGSALDGRVILKVQASNSSNNYDDENDRTLVGNVSQSFDFNAKVFLK